MTALEMKRNTVQPISPSSSSHFGCGGGAIDTGGHPRPRDGGHRRAARDRKLAAARLNNVGAELLDLDIERCTDHAIEILRDSVEILTERKDGLHGGYSFEVAKAEACLSWARKAAGEAKKKKDGSSRQNEDEATRGNANVTGDEESSPSSSSSWNGPFGYAGSIRVPLPTSLSVIDDVGASFVGKKGLLVVLLYNLALAHTIDGSRQGREALISKATALYKMSETVLLQQAAQPEEDEEDETRIGRRGDLAGVDVTSLARSIVNNMGLILFDWGMPGTAREYFGGLTSIRFDSEFDANSRTDDRWNAFEVNAVIAKGLNASAAA